MTIFSRLFVLLLAALPLWAESYPLPSWKEVRFTQGVASRASISVEPSTNQRLPVLKLMIPLRPDRPDQIQVELPVRSRMSAGRWQISLNYRLSAGSAQPIGLGLLAADDHRLGWREVAADKTWQTAVLVADVTEVTEGIRLVVVPGASIQTLEFGDASISLVDASSDPAGATGAVVDSNGSVTLKANQGVVHGTDIRLVRQSPNDCIGYWNDKAAYVEWKADLPQTGTYEAVVSTSSVWAGADLQIEINANTVGSNVPGTGNWDNYVATVLGQITISRPGMTTIIARPNPKGTWNGTNLTTLYLRPLGGNAPSSADNIVVLPKQAILHGALVLESQGGIDDIGYFDNKQKWIEWQPSIHKEGSYEVSISTATVNQGADVNVVVAGTTLSGHVPGTGGWGAFRTTIMGKARIGKVGITSVEVRPDPTGSWNGINVASVTLRYLR